MTASLVYVPPDVEYVSQIPGRNGGAGPLPPKHRIGSDQSGGPALPLPPARTLPDPERAAEHTGSTLPRVVSRVVSSRDRLGAAQARATRANPRRERVTFSPTHATVSRPKGLATAAGARRDERVRRGFAHGLRGAPRRSCRVDRGTDEEDAGSGGRRLVRGGGSSAGNRGRAASACVSRGGASSCGCSARGRSHGGGAGRRAAVPRVHVPRGS